MSAPSWYRVRSRVVHGLILAVFWCGLWGTLDARTFVAGFVVGTLLVIGLPLDSVDQRRDHKFSVVGILRLVAWFVPSLAAASGSVMVAIFDRNRQAPGCVRCQTGPHSSLTMTTIANILSLTPGTLATQIIPEDNGWDLIVHALDATQYGHVVDSIAQIERRVIAAWGTVDERNWLAMRVV